MLRVCTSCKTPKAYKMFYTATTGKKMAICKECHKTAVSENRAAKREHYIAYLREYNKRPDRRAKLRAREKTEAGKETKRIWYRFKKALAA